ncbi:MAG TPA: adventurous gliding motility lipoprotein CglC [Anaeromyxobacter sp.]|nr:adventurous gliding motility lipoprotein CglC [Anaeromyxobacter sp.]
MRSRSLLAVAALGAALAGCQSPDVGQQCQLAWNPNWLEDGTEPPPTAAVLFVKSGPNGPDYFESGNLACDGLVCIVSPAEKGTEYGSETPGVGYCSKPCVSNSDCYQSDTGLACRQMVLDPVFLDQLDPETRSRYLADIQFSSYCAIPR